MVTFLAGVSAFLIVLFWVLVCYRFIYGKEHYRQTANVFGDFAKGTTLTLIELFKDILTHHKFFLFFFVIFAFVILSGCSWPIKPEIIERVKIVKQIIPEANLKPCEPKTLFDKEAYIQLGMYEREERLTFYTLDILSNLSICNKQISEIRKLNSD